MEEEQYERWDFRIKGTREWKSALYKPSEIDQMRRDHPEIVFNDQPLLVDRP